MSNNSYRLIKSYPNCHHELGTVIPKGGMGWKGIYEDLENGLYSEFWEKIKEDEFEIIQYNIVAYGLFAISYDIKTVKRLSDNTTFSIGDKCNLKNGNGFKNPILRFEIRNENFGLEKYRNKDRIVAFLETMDKTEWGPIELDSLVKSKEPLFITEDGVNIYSGDKVFYINYLNTILGPITFDRIGHKHYLFKWFSKEINAKYWVEMNKPQYSEDKIIDTCKKLGWKSGDASDLIYALNNYK